MAGTETIIGAAGYIVAAAMETSGQYIQSQFLDVLANGFAQDFGTLLYLLSAISALFIYVIGGKYKFGLWFFIGPPLFFQCVFVRIASGGAAWQWGDNLRPQERVYVATAGVAADKSGSSDTAAAKEMNIGWFFSEWNKFTSGVVQTTVSLLQGGNQFSQLYFMNQVGKYTSLFRADISDPDLKKFVSLITVGKCGRYFNGIVAANDFSIDSSKGDDLAKELSLRAKQVVFNSDSGPDLVQWLKNSGVKDLAVRTLPQKFDNTGALKAQQALTCEDVWKLSVALARTEAAGLFEKIISQGVESETERDAIKKRLVEKFGTQTNNQDGTVRISDQYSDEEKTLLLMNEVGVNMIIRELRALNPEVAQLNNIPTRLTKTEGGKYVNPDVARSIRLISQYDQYQGKGDFLAAAQSLPYVQGLLLFFLAASYPFFAFALLIPGRHHAMLLWMGLWFWAKSWDIGFALVMIIDDILYSFMPHGPPMGADVANDPVQALKTALEVDPTYSEATYFSLIAACMLAVPPMMGLFIKTGGGEIFSAINQGVRDFSGVIGKSMMRYMQSNKAQDLIAESDMSNYKALQSNKLAAMLKPNIVSEIGSQALYQMAAQYGGQESKLSAEQVSVLTKQAVKEVGTMMQGANAAEAERKTKIVNAMFASNLADAAPYDSYSKENLQRAFDAVALCFNPHDFMLSPPLAEEVAVYQAKANYPIAKEATKWIATQVMSAGKRIEEESIDGGGLNDSTDESYADRRIKQINEESQQNQKIDSNNESSGDNAGNEFSGGNPWSGYNNRSR